MKKVLVLLLGIFLSAGSLSAQEIKKLDVSKILTGKQFVAKVKQQKKLVPKGEFETIAEYKSKLPANPERLMAHVDIYVQRVSNPWDEKESRLNLKYDPEKELFEGPSIDFFKPSLSILLGTKGAGSYAASNAMGASKIVSKVEMNWMDLVAEDVDSLINPPPPNFMDGNNWRWSKGQGETYKPNRWSTHEIKAIRPNIDISLSFRVPRNIAKSLNMKWLVDASILGYTEDQDTQAAKFSYPYEIKQNFTRIYFNYVGAYLHLINADNGEILFTHKLWVDESTQPRYAISKLIKSAERGDAQAQFDLGLMYEGDESVTESYAQAFLERFALDSLEFGTQAAKWFRLAADQGVADAQYKLGLMYRNDKDVSKDYNELAADQGVTDAKYRRALLYKSLSHKGVTKDDAEAAKWFRLAADQGNAAAQYNLALLYERGEGVTEDDAEAAKWFRLSADQGNAEAQNNLGFMYANGKAVPKNDIQAVKWYRLAADQGFADAQNNLGAMYDRGEGVLRDLVQAYMWFSLAAARGSDLGKQNKNLLLKRYFSNRMTPQQITEAEELARNWKPKQ